ncbi:TPA: oligosaccharide flippase family protein, partial [Enterobacter ludwigii]|nr:oligosaccharide flippase family protein [Enterobacter ludwigii]
SLSGASFGCFLNYCLGVFVFNLSTFLIVNLNSVLVGKFAFKEYAYYALSITLVTAVVGFLNAAITPVLQPLVKMVHADDKNKLDRFVYMLSQTLFYLTFFILIANFVIGDYIMKLWVGDNVAIMTYPIFSLLLLTNLTRLISSPLGLVYLAKGKQNEIMYLPLLEGIVSVALTYAFVKTYGIYASAISLGISTILIMLIYSFKLIDISAIETSKGRYRLLLAGGPLIL